MMTTTSSVFVNIVVKLEIKLSKMQIQFCTPFNWQIFSFYAFKRGSICENNKWSDLSYHQYFFVAKNYVILTTIASRILWFPSWGQKHARLLKFKKMTWHVRNEKTRMTGSKQFSVLSADSIFCAIYSKLSIDGYCIFIDILKKYIDVKCA